MNRSKQFLNILTTGLCFVLAAAAPEDGKRELAERRHTVTQNIAEGIEKHIEEQARAGGGYYNLQHNGETLKLKLVRIHTEYLAKLGPRRHFACVDLADTKGDVYDVDFFLEGEPGRMKVTQTTVHKLNGQPFYAWKKNRQGVWVHIPVEKAEPKELGIITGVDRFAFTYFATLPEINGSARMWLPLPRSDRFQTVAIVSKRVPGEIKTLSESEHGNRILFAELGPEHSGAEVEIRYTVERHEKSAYEATGQDVESYLKSESKIPVNERFRDIAQKEIDGKTGKLEQARALYDHTIDRMSYIKFGTGWGKGDAVYACDVRSGNCSDFHSYFIALARAVDIPARFAIGAAIPSSRDEGGVDGYHCWAEFYAEGKWWPVDISEGDKYSRLATYYFGHHPANRFEFSRGRDLVVEPGPESGPINFLAYPVLEINGTPATTDVEFYVQRTPESID